MASDDNDIVLTFSEDDHGPGYEGKAVLTNRPLWQSPSSEGKKSKGANMGIQSKGFAWREKMNVLNPWKFAYPDRPKKDGPTVVTISRSPEITAPAEEVFWTTDDGQ